MITTVELANAAAVSYRQADHWTRQGYLAPAVEARGSGTQRLYPPSEAVVARILGRWSDLAGGGSLRDFALELRASLADPEPDGKVTVGLGDALVWLEVDVAAARAEVDEYLARFRGRAQVR